MVSLEDRQLPGQGRQRPQILFHCVPQVHGPGDVSHQEYSVFFLYGFLPVCDDFFPMAQPLGSKDLHGLGGGLSGKMQIPHGINCHSSHSFLR